MTASSKNISQKRRLILRSNQSPGDILMLTAAVRDLHAAYPEMFVTDVRTSAEDIWANNPFLTPLLEDEQDVEIVDMHYPLVHNCNQHPYHFVEAFPRFLEEKLGLPIPVTDFRGDIHLSQQERDSLSLLSPRGFSGNYWIVIGGGKYDFTAKWWNPNSYQAVVDHFRGRIQFVQCGDPHHWHPKLRGVINLIGRTTLRELIRLVYRADGVLCPITLAMHLAAAVETPPGSPDYRAAVILAGGREPRQWEAYPEQRFLSTVGTLSCCQQGGCWKSRCQTVGDGDKKDLAINLCEKPVQISPELRIPRCLDMITPRDAIRAIELYYEGGGLRYLSKASSDMKQTTQTPRLFQRFLNEPSLTESQQTLVRYPESLKSAMQLTVVLRHLHHYYPNCDFDVVSSSAQAAALAGVCRKVYVEGRDRIDTSQYDEVLFFKTPSHSDATDRSFVSEPNRYLIDELLLEPIAAFGKYEIGMSEAVQQQAGELLAARCSKVPEDDEGRFAVVLIQDGTGQRLPSKRLTAEIVNELALTVSGLGYTPLLLRSTEARRAPVSRAISQHVTDELVLNTIEINEIGLLAAVIEFSSMVISIDTGVLHVAAATTTPTVGVWNSPQPIEQISPADNVLHLIADEEEAGRHVGAALPFTGVRFRRFKQLDVELPAVVQSMLTGRDVQQLITERFLNQFAPTGFAERYLHEEKSRGVDYLYFGRWQKQYGQWLVESLDLKDKRVLDVGCASGAITRSLSRAGAIALGVDINEALIRLGKAKWEELEELLQVCDAVNLHRIADQSQDCVHAGRVLEYLRPQQVEVALSEMRRVTKPEGLLLVMIKKQRSDIRGQSDQPDPRQLCVQPLSWWHDRLPAAGWQLCSEEIAHDLQTHPFCCLNRVWWDWFAARPV